MSKAAAQATNDEPFDDAQGERRTTNAERSQDRWSLVAGRWSLASGWGGEVITALAFGLLAILLLALGFSRAWPLALDVGVRDARFVAGFNETEDFGGRLVRWTRGDATIALPRVPDGASAALSLRLLNSRPNGMPDPHVTISADGRPLGVFDVGRTPGGSGIHTYRLLIPGGAAFDWATRIRLESDTIALPNDPRPLGVVVDQVALEPLGGRWVPPSLWLICWGAALGALGYALPRSIGLGRASAYALAVALAALVAWGVAARPLEVLPFLHRLALLPGLGCLGIWLARLLAPPLPTNDERPTTNEERRTNWSSASRWSLPALPLDILGNRVVEGVVGRWSIRGADLPIYLAAVWWMGPLFQLILTADAVDGVSPPVPTMWIGGALALALVGLGGWYALRGRVLSGQQRAATLAHAALALFFVAALAHLVYMIWFAFQRQGPDFWILFKGARDWARGGSLYDVAAVIENHFGHVFKVPPFYGMLFVPFVFQDGERVLFFHRIMNVVLLSATALVWLRMWGLRMLSSAGLGALLLLNFRPMTDTMAFGQIDLALLLILTLALWALQAHRDFTAGALVALGTLFKVYPLLLLAFFVVKGRWRALIGFALGMLVMNGIAIVVMGWGMHRVYLFEVLPRIGGTTSWVENQTISGFIARLAASPTESTIFHNRPLELLGLGLSGLAGLLACLLALRPASATGTSFALQYSQFPLIMVLAVPAAWMHYETLLFLPFAALLLHEHERAVGLTRACLLAISFALVAYGNPWSYYLGTVMGVLTILGVSYKFYGMLLLGGVLAATLLAERGQVAEPAVPGRGWRQRWAHHVQARPNEPAD